MKLRNLYNDVLTLWGINRRCTPWCGPRIAQINISDNCNLNCTICNHSSMGVSGLLPAGKVTSLVDELYGLGTQEVFFHGFGEPGLHPQLPEMLHYAMNSAPGMRTHLITNGTWNSPRLLEAIHAGKVGVRFSLHGGDAETWHRIHPYDDLSYFRQAEQNLRELTGTAPERVEVLFVICKTNCDKIKEMVQFARDHGVRKILFRPMRLFKDRIGQFMNAHLLPDAGEFQEASGIVARFRQELRGKIDVHSVAFEQNSFDQERNRPSSRTFYLSRSCYIGYVLTVIERDGNVWGCLPESSSGEPLGSIHEASFREIWYGRAYEDFRRKQLFLDKSLLDDEGCHTYCQHLDTNIRLNRLRLWKNGWLRPRLKARE